MDALITRLTHQTDGLDTSDLAPAEHLPSVVRRGRRYLVAVSTVTVVGATAAVAGAVVAVPQVLEQLQGPQQPVVQPLSDDDQTVDDQQDSTDEQPGDEANRTPRVDEPVEGADDQQPSAVLDAKAPPADVTAPDLVVLSPSDGTTVTSEKVTFTGEVEPGASVTAGPYEATVKDDGTWSIVLIAQPGDNTVTFTATDAAGNTATATVTVSYAPEKGDDGADEAKLTANQKKAELTAAPHVNTYWGTAQPEAKVAVVSDHGTAYTWADASGEWAVEVDFNPPAGTTTFPVTVKLYHQPEVATTFTLTTVASETQAFSASQQHAKLTGEPYTNVYWGTAAPGEKIKVMWQYGWAYTYADEAGNWELEVTFDPPAGTNEFDVTARYYHDSGVSKTFRLTTVAPDAAAFTATQQHASVPATDPTNTYSGTGEPGHEILIWTEAHGQTTTQVAADGTWQVSLTYQGVAAGDTFKVKAADMDGGTRHYFDVTIIS